MNLTNCKSKRNCQYSNNSWIEMKIHPLEWHLPLVTLEPSFLRVNENSLWREKTENQNNFIFVFGCFNTTRIAFGELIFHWRSRVNSYIFLYYVFPIESQASVQTSPQFFCWAMVFEKLSVSVFSRFLTENVRLYLIWLWQ